MRNEYEKCVKLLIDILPIIERQTDFAIKGGTAINLFYQDFPRYSEDIDLAYLPISDRQTSLIDIASKLNFVGKQIEESVFETTVKMKRGGGNLETRISASSELANVKIEVSPVFRGSLFPPSNMSVSESVKKFYKDTNMLVVSFDEVYAGKFSAALDRSLPRDLFDVKIFFENHQLSDSLFRATLIYLLCASRPIHELLSPKEIDIDDQYDGFKSMMRKHVSLEELYSAKKQLLNELHKKLEGTALKFLEDFHQCRPDFSLIGLPQAAELPAIKWKLLNLNKLRVQGSEKHKKLIKNIRRLIEL